MSNFFKKISKGTTNILVKLIKEQTICFLKLKILNPSIDEPIPYINHCNTSIFI